MTTLRKVAQAASDEWVSSTSHWRTFCLRMQELRDELAKPDAPAPQPAGGEREAPADILTRLRNTPNWMRESYGSWKDCVLKYDRAPFEAAEEIERLRAALSQPAAQQELKPQAATMCSCIECIGDQPEPTSEDLAQAAPQPAGGERAWLVESKVLGHGPQWWGFNREPRKHADWCSDANDAIRFSRKADAESMRLHIIAVAGLTGRHDYERTISATEHQWCLSQGGQPGGEPGISKGVT